MKTTIYNFLFSDNNQLYELSTLVLKRDSCTINDLLFYKICNSEEYMVLVIQTAIWYQ